ncbi:MAG: hypothetical protein M5R36_14650 [Deltaproteobacteria bacterium]|nr:hypothetical protein [Deltaproteobacteria bacterium]
MPENLKITQEFVVKKLEPLECISMPFVDWKHLRVKVERNNFISPILATISSLSSALSFTLFSIAWQSSKPAIGFTIAGVVLLIFAIASGLFALYLSGANRKDLISDLDHVERKYWYDSESASTSSAPFPQENIGKIESNWVPAQGNWLTSGDVIEIDDDESSPIAHYIWRRDAIRAGSNLSIRFAAEFPKSGKLDLRIALFSRSYQDNYNNGDHLLIYLPWEGGMLRLDALKKGVIDHLAERSYPLNIRKYDVQILIDNDFVSSFINGHRALSIPTRKLSGYFSRTQWHLGISTVCGRLKICNFFLEN